MAQLFNFVGYLWICTILIVLLTLIHNGSTQIYEDAEEHDTVHKRMGQDHIPNVIYSKYQSQFNNTEPIVTRTMGLTPISGFAESFFETIVRNRSMDGYVTLENGSSLTLGEKAIENNWKDMLAKNKVLILILLIFLALAIIMPFVAVCYCCFCCCRCRKTCPPCAEKGDAKRRLWCTILLMFLILGLFFGLLMTFLANKLLNRGSTYMIRRQRIAGLQICSYIRDVTDHVNHLLIVNYEEIKAHALEQATDAYKHLLLDLSDTSGGNALTDMERILNNMDEASSLMKDVDVLQLRLKFTAATLRDAYRGFKRHLIQSLAVYCVREVCRDLLTSSGVLTWDTSKCLHLDALPNTTAFWETMEKSVDQKLANIAEQGIARLEVIGHMMQEATAPILPPLRKRLEDGALSLRSQNYHIKNLLNKTLRDIYSSTQNTTKEFQDFYDRYGYNSNMTHVIVCLCLLLIIILLIVGVIWGLCVRTNNFGSTALLIAILVIFCVFSFITIVGLFNLTIGMITYLGACRSIKFDNNTPPVNLQGCGETGTIFGLLKSSGKYDLSRIKNIRILDDDETSWHEFKDDLSHVSLISGKDIVLLREVLENLYIYHSKLYTNVMCKTPASPGLVKQAKYQYDRIMQILYYDESGDGGEPAWISILYTRNDLEAYEPIENEFVPLITRIEEKLHKIDSLLLSGNRNFNETFQPLIESVVHAQEFIKSEGRSYINSLGKNLTTVIDEQLSKYLDMVVAECSFKVGSCHQLGMIYSRDMEFLCQNLVAPINAFWVGLLLSSLLLIPTLIVAHYLMCLYRVHKIYTPPVLHLRRDDFSCPTCSGGPIVPRPIVICTGGQRNVPYNGNQLDSDIIMPKRKRE